jgi:type IV fimbrial biogenesis protein FimT
MGANARLGVSATTVATSSCCTTAIAAGTGMGTNPPPGVVFNAFGQVITDASVTKVTRIDVTNAVAANARRMVITITSSGMAKLCDPALPSSNSRGCN